MMNFINSITPIASLIMFILQAVFTIFMIVLSSKFVTDRVRITEDTAAGMDKEIGYINEKMSALPTAKDLHELSVIIAKLQGSLETHQALTGRLQKQVDVLDDYLRNMEK
jgi:Protein of unknown function (DUF2730)